MKVNAIVHLEIEIMSETVYEWAVNYKEYIKETRKAKELTPEIIAARIELKNQAAMIEALFESFHFDPDEEHCVHDELFMLGMIFIMDAKSLETLLHSDHCDDCETECNCAEYAPLMSLQMSVIFDKMTEIKGIADSVSDDIEKHLK